MAAQTLVIRTTPDHLFYGRGGRKGGKRTSKGIITGEDKDTVVSCILYNVLVTSTREPEQSRDRDEEGSPPPHDGDNQDMSTMPAYACTSAAEMIQ